MFQKIKEFLFGKLPVEQTPSAPVEAVPYKVEAPAPAAPIPPTPVQCGCGRSPTGVCVGLHKLSADEWAVHADNPAKAVPVAAPAALAKKQPAPKAATKPAAKAAPRKPAAIKAAPKKSAPRKPAAK